MGFADLAANGPPDTTTAATKIDKLLAELPPDEAAGLRAILDDPAWEHTQVAKAMDDNGHPVADSTVGRWRRSHGIR